MTSGRLKVQSVEYPDCGVGRNLFLHNGGCMRLHGFDGKVFGNVTA